MSSAENMFDLAQVIAEASSGSTDDQIKKAVKMALVAIGKEGLMVDPTEIRMAGLYVTPQRKPDHRSGCNCESCKEWNQSQAAADFIQSNPRLFGGVLKCPD
jgi:hypothetical protein